LTSESYQLCIGSLVLAAEAVLFTSSSALRIEMHAEGLVEDLATKAADYLVVSAEIDLPV
jgi:signal recognition particle receptor subunit beta